MVNDYIEKLHFEDNNRVFDCYLYDKNQIPPEEMDGLVDFYKIWIDCIAEGYKIPRRKDISFEKLVGWHSNIRIVDYGKEKSDPKKTILIGEIYSKYWGSEIMNEKVRSDNPPPPSSIKKYESFLNNIYEYNYAISVGLSPNDSGSMLKVMWIDLPLCDDEGNVSHLLSALKIYDE